MNHRCLALLVGALVGVCSIVIGVPADGDHGLTVHFIDVEHGDAILVKHGDWEALLDAGPPTSAAQARLREHLDHLVTDGVIELAILSHNHDDHYGGFTALLAADSGFRIGVFWRSYDTEPDTDGIHYRAFQQALDESGVRVVFMQAGDPPQLAGGLEWHVLSPGDLRTTTTNDNDNSLVLLLRYQDATALFPGDIPGSVERTLVDAGLVPSIGLLKVPHHGSDTTGSTSSTFLNAARPEFSVISVGSRYKLPHAEVLRRLAEAGTAVFRTDMHGSITATWHGNRWVLAPQKDDVLAPLDLTGAWLADGGYRLSWYDLNAYTVGSVVERRSADGWARTARLPAGTLEYMDRSATSGVQYCYRVLAFNAASYSAPSNEFCTPGGGCFVEWVARPDRIQRGTFALVEIRTGPGTACRATYKMPSGTTQDLGLVVADSTGKASWLIGGKTGEGNASFQVVTDCGRQDSFEFLIHKKP